MTDRSIEVGDIIRYPFGPLPHGQDDGVSEWIAALPAPWRQPRPDLRRAARLLHIVEESTPETRAAWLAPELDEEVLGLGHPGVASGGRGGAPEWPQPFASDGSWLTWSEDWARRRDRHPWLRRTVWLVRLLFAVSQLTRRGGARGLRALRTGLMPLTVFELHVAAAQESAPRGAAPSEDVTDVLSAEVLARRLLGTGIPPRDRPPGWPEPFASDASWVAWSGRWAQLREGRAWLRRTTRPVRMLFAVAQFTRRGGARGLRALRTGLMPLPVFERHLAEVREHEAMLRSRSRAALRPAEVAQEQERLLREGPELVGRAAEIGVSQQEWDDRRGAGQVWNVFGLTTEPDPQESLDLLGSLGVLTAPRWRRLHESLRAVRFVQNVEGASRVREAVQEVVARLEPSSFIMVDGRLIARSNVRGASFAVLERGLLIRRFEPLDRPQPLRSLDGSETALRSGADVPDPVGGELSAFGFVEHDPILIPWSDRPSVAVLMHRRNEPAAFDFDTAVARLLVDVAELPLGRSPASRDELPHPIDRLEDAVTGRSSVEDLERIVDLLRRGRLDDASAAVAAAHAETRRLLLLLVNGWVGIWSKRSAFEPREAPVPVSSEESRIAGFEVRAPDLHLRFTWGAPLGARDARHPFWSDLRGRDAEHGPEPQAGCYDAVLAPFDFSTAMRPELFLEPRYRPGRLRLAAGAEGLADDADADDADAVEADRDLDGAMMILSAPDFSMLRSFATSAEARALVELATPSSVVSQVDACGSLVSDALGLDPAQWRTLRAEGRIFIVAALSGGSSGATQATTALAASDAGLAIAARISSANYFEQGVRFIPWRQVTRVFLDDRWDPYRRRTRSDTAVDYGDGLDHLRDELDRAVATDAALTELRLDPESERRSELLRAVSHDHALFLGSGLTQWSQRLIGPVLAIEHAVVADDETGPSERPSNESAGAPSRRGDRLVEFERRVQERFETSAPDSAHRRQTSAGSAPQEFQRRTSLLPLWSDGAVPTEPERVQPELRRFLQIVEDHVRSTTSDGPDLRQALRRVHEQIRAQFAPRDWDQAVAAGVAATTVRSAGLPVRIEQDAVGREFVFTTVAATAAGLVLHRATWDVLNQSHPSSRGEGFAQETIPWRALRRVERSTEVRECEGLRIEMFGGTSFVVDLAEATQATSERPVGGATGAVATDGAVVDRMVEACRRHIPDVDRRLEELGVAIGRAQSQARIDSGSPVQDWADALSSGRIVTVTHAIGATTDIAGERFASRVRIRTAAATDAGLVAHSTVWDAMVGPDPRDGAFSQGEIEVLPWRSVSAVLRSASTLTVETITGRRIDIDLATAPQVDADEFGEGDVAGDLIGGAEGIARTVPLFVEAAQRKIAAAR